MKKEYKICIVGLGYVGLPLAIEFAKKYKTIGFDIDENRIKELKSFKDKTLEVSGQQLKSVLSQTTNFDLGLYVTQNSDDISSCNVYIITVPTPINKHKQPILSPLLNASKLVANYVKKNDIIIYESTVYPGLTEDICVPVIEKNSGLRLNHDFSVGYSPERINPGDKERTVAKILKITSGSNAKAAKIIDEIYSSVIEAGTYLASSIKVAEAAKVIENSQRDINIAFVNELAKIFNLMEIDTNEVLEAASTKWNFLPFKPGLVGGHCIGVDPYYLAQKSIELGYNPEIILSGRRINDSMAIYVANEIIKLMVKKEIKIKDANLLILGITFKENCPDVRNTKVVDLINHLKSFGILTAVYDPHADSSVVLDEYGLKITESIKEKKYDGIILAVAHSEFIDLDLEKLQNTKSFIYDIKGALGNEVDMRL